MRTNNLFSPIAKRQNAHNREEDKRPKQNRNHHVPRLNARQVHSGPSHKPTDQGVDEAEQKAEDEYHRRTPLP